MGGLFGVVSREDCIDDIFYGTDYHSHLGTMRGGLAVNHPNNGIKNVIHDITGSQFRSKLEDDVEKMRGCVSGIGVISDFDSQPLVIESHLGQYAIATVGVIKNLAELKQEAFRRRTAHFQGRSAGEVSPTEMVASLINQEGSFEAGIQNAQELIQGSCSMVLLTEDGIYAARDRLGRTPLIIGERKGKKIKMGGELKELSDAYVLTSETCALPNLRFDVERELGPGEIVLVNSDTIEQKKAPNKEIQVCSFLWVYYGFPASTYEGINVEEARYKCGAELAKADRGAGFDFSKIDMVAGIPDSGSAHAIGYANEAGIPYKRPVVKYTPTWPRSFMPQDQSIRDLVAQMKLITIKEMIEGKSILFCEDSIVRGTQLRDNIDFFFELGAKEIHMRPACPPLIYGCNYLNFSRSKNLADLAGIRGIMALEGIKKLEDLRPEVVQRYTDEDSQAYQKMVNWIKDDLHLTSLRYQKLSDLVDAIGIPKEKLCTHCWDGSSHY